MVGRFNVIFFWKKCTGPHEFWEFQVPCEAPRIPDEWGEITQLIGVK